MAEDRASVKNEDTYVALRDKGASKFKAAAIANAQARDDMQPSVKGGKASPYEDRTKKELLELARERDIAGRSKMDKKTLILALRDD